MCSVPNTHARADSLLSLFYLLLHRLPFEGGVLTPAVAGGHKFIEALQVRETQGVARACFFRFLQPLSWLAALTTGIFSPLLLLHPIHPPSHRPPGSLLRCWLTITKSTSPKSRNASSRARCSSSCFDAGGGENRARVRRIAMRALFPIKPGGTHFWFCLARAGWGRGFCCF